jgi:enoyl-CoA hydratase/carnithine racemase
MGQIDLGSRHLRASAQDGVLTVTLDRLERRNACTIDMYHGIKKAAVLAEKDPSIDVLVITGTGEVFCVGGEMGERHEAGSSIDARHDDWDVVPFVQIERCPKIVVCAVNGLCQGGGLNLVLVSDVCVASENAQFRAPELLRGIADCWLSARLAAHVGMARAKYLMFAAPTISAAEAAAMGLVARVSTVSGFATAVRETIDQIRQTAPRARRAVKYDLNRGLPTIDVEMFTGSLASEEAAEGFRAFMEKRKPRWSRS